MRSAIGIAGSGRVAQALGRLLGDRGEPVVAVAGRDPARAEAAAAFIGSGVEAVRLEELSARAGRILVAVADVALPAVAETLARAGFRDGVALHTCGARGPEALAPIEHAGLLHPLQTIASPEQGVAALPGSAFAVSGDAAAVEWARSIVALLAGTPLEIAPERLPLYHAAAVMASNYVHALTDAAVILMVSAGLEAGTALAALAPLIRSSAENSIALGPDRALTGPIERGDEETVRRHLRALACGPPEVGALYRAAGLQVLGIARRRGLGEAAAGRIESLLREGV
jgi:predicted short-subunit dehydrogenase-like oxidoreductase (DUF2520 family)